MYQKQKLLPPECQSVIAGTQRNRSQMMRVMREESQLNNQLSLSNFGASRTHFSSEERRKQAKQPHKDPKSTISKIAVSLDVCTPNDRNHLRTKLAGSKIQSSKLLSTVEYYQQPYTNNQFEDDSWLRTQKRSSSLCNQQIVLDQKSTRPNSQN